MRHTLLAIAVAGCGGHDAPAPAQQQPAPGDAAVDGITTIGSAEPGALDRDPASVRTPPMRAKNRPARPVDIMLKSTPSGAIAAVDGVQVGVTPTYWFGESDGREHEFTFVLPRYAVGRYRFVPLQSGVVHARLEPVAADDTVDAGVAEPPPSRPPPEPVPPPPTVLTPDAAVVIPVPPAADAAGSGSARP